MACEGLKVGIGDSIDSHVFCFFITTITGPLPGNLSDLMYHDMRYRNFYLTGCLVAAMFSASALPATAQEWTDPWHGSVEFNPVFPTYEGATPLFNLNLTAMRKINDYVGWGFGIGIMESFKFDEAPTIPLFVRAHAEDYSKQWSPYFDFDLGYGLNLDNLEANKLIINPTVGIRYGAVSIGIGYYGAKILKEGYKMSNAINVRLAYYFGYHRSDSPLANALRSLEFGVDFGVRIPMSGGTKEREGSSAHGRYTTGADVTLSLLYPVNDNLSVGIMSGFGIIGQKSTTKFGTNSDVRSMIPIALRGKYRFREISVAGKFYPFVSFDLGMAINPDTNAGCSSFYWSPAAGLAFDVAEGRHSIELGVGYVPQTVEKLQYAGSVEDWSDVKTHTAGNLRIALGYTF